MKTLTIVKPSWIINTDDNIVINVFSNIIEEYTDFDIKLMNKYFETKNLDDSSFVNI